MAAVRNNSDIVKGDQLWLFIATNATGTANPVAFATNCTLNRSLSTNSISSKDHGTSSFVTPGEGSWTASSEALMALGGTSATLYQDMMTTFGAGNPEVKCVFGYVSDGGATIVDNDEATSWTMGNPHWEGVGYITSLQASGQHGDAATWSIEINGNGPLTATLS